MSKDSENSPGSIPLFWISIALIMINLQWIHLTLEDLYNIFKVLGWVILGGISLGLLVWLYQVWSRWYWGKNIQENYRKIHNRYIRRQKIKRFLGMEHDI